MKSACPSRVRMRRRVRAALTGCLLATLAFYGWQNGFAEQGGALSLPKAFWLGLTVCCWLVLPPLVFCAPHIGRRLRAAYLLFWLPMLARAVIELWLLYGRGGWQYVYGMAHDVFSLLLLAVLAGLCRRERPRVWVGHLWVMAAMFAAETYFARYISAFNHGRHSAELWFIGWQPPHLANQLLTAALAVCLCGWLMYLERRA